MTSDMTLREISQRSGVSITTVSRVLSNSENVSGRARNKVMAAINGDSFSPNKKTGLIAFFIPDSSNFFFTQLLHGIETVAMLQDYNIIVCHIDNNSIYEDKFLKKMQDIEVEGIIYVTSGSMQPALKEIILEKSVPIVFLDRKVEIQDSVLVTADNENGMFQASKYLVSLGHKKILYLDGNENLSTAKDRRRGMEKAAAQNDIDVEYVSCDFTIKTSYKMINKMIDENKLNATAICSANDVMAIGAYQALVEHGYKIPEDISLIGYDNIPEAAILNLTTIQQPWEEMGRTAIIALLSLINGRDIKPLNSVLKTSLIIRNSCASVTKG